MTVGGTYSRVTDGNLPEPTATNILTKIPSNSLDIRRGGRRRTIIDNLITGEESQSILILGELLDGSKDVLQIDIIVGLLRLRAIDRVLGGIDVEHEVDASIGQRIHTLIVILGVVDRVDTDGVDAQFLELGDIALAAVDIGDGVREIGGTARLVVKTANVEALVAFEESVAFDGNRGDIVAGLEGGSGQGRGDKRGGRSGQGEGLHDVDGVD